jgi:hypothetical protein
MTSKVPCDSVPCPICQTLMSYSERYPKALCNAHYDECIDIEGRKVTYSNEGFHGGFVSEHFVNDNLVETAKDGCCAVRGVICFAQEARFGGIVIQVSSKDT